MFVFILALFCDMFDRTIINYILKDIKADFQLSDTAMGLLMGIGFALFYSILGIPIARLVDSRSRRVIMACGIAIWSLFSAGCGLAQNFWQLFIARMGVGVGEACNGPSTYSMMSDLFPRERLTRAASVLQIGFVLGTGLASVASGAVIALVSSWPEVHIPGIGVMRHWQMIFIIVGLPGLLIAGLLFTIDEPKRRGLIQGMHGNVAAKKAIPFRDVVKFLGENWKFYGPMYLGLAVNGLILGGQQWIPEFFRRTYNMEITRIAYIQGTVVIIFSLIGLFVGTKIGEWFIKRGHADANLRLVVLANILAIPVAIIYPLMPNAWLAFAFLGVNMFIRFLSPGAQNAALQSVTPNEMRGQITAIFLFIFNLVGYGIGPFYIGALTDLIGAESQLRYSLAASTAIAGPIATFILWRAMKPYGEMYNKAKQWVG